MHWILLRGLTREAAHWGDFPARLQAAWPGVPVHCVDLPGTGRLFKARSPSTIPAIRAHLQAAVAHIPPPYGVLALSMGGMVALDWAQQAEHGLIQRLVMINSSSGFNPPWQRLRPAVWPQLLRLFTLRDRHAREAAILRLCSARPVTPDLIQRWYSIQVHRPVSLASASAQLSAAARYRPAPRAPATSGLLLASRADRLVNWQCSDTLARRWDWPLHLHPDAGHDLPLDDPDWVIARISAWLSAFHGAQVCSG